MRSGIGRKFRNVNHQPFAMIHQIWHGACNLNDVLRGEKTGIAIPLKPVRQEPLSLLRWLFCPPEPRRGISTSVDLYRILTILGLKCTPTSARVLASPLTPPPRFGLRSETGLMVGTENPSIFVPRLAASGDWYGEFTVRQSPSHHFWVHGLRIILKPHGSCWNSGNRSMYPIAPTAKQKTLLD